jgi:hypothetical protein
LINVLNHKHFDTYFSKIIIEKEKVYKEYFIRHDVSDSLKNITELIFISNSLSLLERRHLGRCKNNEPPRRKRRGIS